MKTARLYFILILVFHGVTSFSQSRLIYITHHTISEVCFDRGRFVSFTSRQIKVLESFQQKLKTPHHLIVQTIIRKDTSPVFFLAACPELNQAEENELLAELGKIKPVKSYLIDFVYAIELLDKRKTKDTTDVYLPPVRNPLVEAENNFMKASLEGKIFYLKEKARNEALPVLSAFASSSHQRYQDVISIGNRINKVMKNSNPDVDSMTTYNPRYWKALIEMMPDNYLLYAIKIYLLISNGELDKAYRLLSVLDLFKKNNSIADYYLDELIWLHVIFRQQDLLLDSVQKLIDQQQFHQAQEKLHHLLDIFPTSALAWNKQLVLNQAEGKEYDFDIETLINRYDPVLCPHVDSLRMSSDRICQLKKEADSLFQNRAAFHRDFMRYADISLQSGDYDFAAHLYWLAITHFSDKEAGRDNLNAYFLYCLDKLGHHDLVLQLDADAYRKFQDIEAKLR